jgi:hypothetical protein
LGINISLSLFVTEEAHEPENEKKRMVNAVTYRKCDFSLPVMVPLLEMGRPFSVMVNCAFGYLQIHSREVPYYNWKEEIKGNP